jgi:tRNA pseudouridine32 synthase/23S rRNA pseudouridine746 synthase
VHSAHADGLNAPIKGDTLYGRPADRLYLHAESITFVHPATGEKMTVVREADF